METDEKRSAKTEEQISRLGRMSALTLATTLAIFGIRFVKSVVLARLLGPANRGILGFLTLVPNLAATLGSMGFGPAIIFFTDKEGYDRKKVVGGTIFFAMVMGALLMVASQVIFLFEDLFQDRLKYLKVFSVLCFLSIPVYLMHRFETALLTAMDLIPALNLMRVLTSLVPLASFVALWAIMDAPLQAAVISWFISLIVVGAVPLFGMRGQGAFPPALSLEFVRKGLAYGAKSHLANIFQLLMLRIDYLFIYCMLGAKPMGYYVVATGLAEVLQALPRSFTLPLVPILFGMKKEDAEESIPLVIKSVFVTMVLAALATLLVGRFVIDLAFGDRFLPAFAPLCLLLPGIVTMEVNNILRYDLFRRNRPGLVSIPSGIALAVNIGLNCVLIPRYGIEGAAISSSVSYTLSMILLHLCFSRLSGKGMISTLVPTRSDARMIVENLRKRRRKGKS